MGADKGDDEPPSSATQPSDDVVAGPLLAWAGSGTTGLTAGYYRGSPGDAIRRFDAILGSLTKVQVQVQQMIPFVPVSDLSYAYLFTHEPIQLSPATTRSLSLLVREWGPSRPGGPADVCQ